MKRLRFWRNAAGAAFVLLALQVLQSHLLEEALRQQDQVLAARLETSVADVLSEAHKAGDDLTIFHVMHALEHSPGVLAARILKPMESGYPLRNSAGEWGRLRISVGDRLTGQLIRRQSFIGALALGFLWGIMTLYLYRTERSSAHLCAKIDELQGLLEAEKRQSARSEERERLTARQGATALQKALQRIPEPLVVLDPHQRVWALNEAALSRLQVTGSVIQKSWHEIPVLESCGPPLEQSLATPGQLVESCVQRNGLKLTFETDPASLSGTWIAFTHD